MKDRISFKTIMYRIYSSFVVTPLIVFLSTGNWSMAFTISFIEIFVKILSYYVFERIYNSLK
ncbi:hypothetical protein DRN86_05845 [Candidatus Geothermarchaeota archaeon]|nr:MAG: hypothetical protein DRN86_05845 [Candidatus Geothermarchaeota archaeon]